MNCRKSFERRIGALIALSFVSAVMLAASCSDDEVKTRAREEETKEKPVAARPSTTPDDGKIHRDSQALHVLITVNNAEVELGKIAEAKASDPDVKELATKMVTEHTAATERLTSLAQQKGITPEANDLSDELKKDADTMKARLEAFTGAAFDMAYIEGQLALHTKARAAIDNQLTPAMADPDLKKTVGELRSTIEGHLLEVQELRRALSMDASVTRDSGTSSSGGTGAGWPDGGLGFDGGGLGPRDSGLALPDPGDLQPPGQGNLQQPPGPGDIQMPNPGDIQVPNPGDIQPPGPGDIQMPPGPAGLDLPDPGGMLRDM